MTAPRAGAERSSSVYGNAARNQGSSQGTDPFFASTALGRVRIPERAGNLGFEAGPHRLFHAIQDFVVILVAPDPKPPEVVPSPERDSAVGSPDINRPDISFGPGTQGKDERALV